MKILGIETTCDETSAGVVKDSRLVLSNIISSQAKLHNKYGGIVPEIASRKHLEVLPIVTHEALLQAKTHIDDIDAVAVSKEPGLPPALSVGYAYASGLALANKKPLVEVNHLESHISGIWIYKNKKDKKKIPYPYICLLVSGGHTQIRLVTNSINQRIIGQTLDDAAGEAFDKIARLLNLSYPGGPEIERVSKEGDENTINFPRPMIKSDDFNFSFSGLKSAVKREFEKLNKFNIKYKNNKTLYKEINHNFICDIGASFQEAITDVLVFKTIKAANTLGINTITIAGGVSVNSRLREKLARACHEEEFSFYYPETEFCLDNAAMVAARGAELIKN